MAALGTLIGISAVWFGIRKPLKDPPDARERRDLVRYGVFRTVLIIAFVVGIVALIQVRGWIPHLGLALAAWAASAGPAPSGCRAS